MKKPAESRHQWQIHRMLQLLIGNIQVTLVYTETLTYFWRRQSISDCTLAWKIGKSLEMVICRSILLPFFQIKGYWTWNRQVCKLHITHWCLKVCCYLSLLSTDISGHVTSANSQNDPPYALEIVKLLSQRAPGLHQEALNLKTIMQYNLFIIIKIILHVFEQKWV